MKTSPLRLKSAAAAEDRARSVRSFAAAAALYAPLLRTSKGIMCNSGAILI